ncbi:MAG TPA: pyruvate dehydrogenase (acetyl-transferring) E1 component subunit alpha [Chloroflexota bacterium]|jgi:pyruvate dehydrogenase E1 component alpha subunit|nr:pyruvate dehydrogenase (acetyl-transferring) E1 component subunit alpha [Chloroflexota bacterium]
MPKERGSANGRGSGSARVADKELAVASATAADPPLGRYDRAELLRMLAQMQLIRHFEERAAEQYTRAKVGGYIHLNVGEEATVVGAIAALRPGDYFLASYRSHGHALSMGTDPGAVMAELFGRETGTSRGRGGSMHLVDVERGFLGGYGIVGGQLPVAVGVAFAVDYRGTPAAVMCQFGEGATNIGAFHESLNAARLWHLPVVWFCTNNLYAMGHSVEMDSAVTEIYRKAVAYDIPGERVDGMDVLAVRQVCEVALERARRERMPTLIEAVTYRYRGHSMADAGRYRTDDEVRRWRERDPITWFEKRLVDAGLLDEETAAGIEQRAIEAAQQAVEFAEHSPEPDADDLGLYVYADEDT